MAGDVECFSVLFVFCRLEGVVVLLALVNGIKLLKYHEQAETQKLMQSVTPSKYPGSTSTISDLNNNVNK